MLIRNRRNTKAIPGSSNLVIANPAVEAFFDQTIVTAWHPDVFENENVQKASALRTRICEQLERLYGLIPCVSMDISQALHLKLVVPEDLVPLYESLTDYFSQEHYSERLILYFPLELLPDITGGPTAEPATTVFNKFCTVYLEKWHKLLSWVDIRADFIDGDIPDFQWRPGKLPEVVKAAHLAPILFKKELLSMDELREIIHDAESDTLRQSLEEAICSMDTHSMPVETDKGPKRSMGWLTAQIRNAQDNTRIAERKIQSEGAKKPEVRIKWESEEVATEIQISCADSIAISVHGGHLDIQDLNQALVRAESTHAILVLVHAVRLLVVRLAPSSVPKAQETYAITEAALEKIWLEGGEEAHNALITLWSHAHCAGIVTGQVLERHGITIPHFEKDVSLRTEEILSQYESPAEAIIKDPELSSLILPVVVCHGSHIKGYGSSHSDIDLGIFVRAGVSREHTERIRKLVQEVLGPFGINDVVEFWLEEVNGQLVIRNFYEFDRHLGHSLMTHMLFACPWIGNERAIKRLYEKLLAGYLLPTQETIVGMPAKQAWLDGIERSALRYRLMHKGYKKYFPNRRSALVQKGVCDPESSFWDSGFRRVATLIFLKKVFLPHM